MYGYNEKRLFISANEILKKVKQEDIIQMALGYIPKEHRYVLSPFRDDKSPDCYFEWYNGWLWFIDWAWGTKHRDCFNIVQDKFGLTFYESLQLINSHFKLNLESSSIRPETKVLEIERSTTSKAKAPKDITFKARPFNNTVDKDFWKPYEISKENLTEDNVFPVIWYRIYSKKLKNYVAIRPLTKAYSIATFGERTKIYTPDNTGKGKWITNCTENDIGGTGADTGDLLVITKSYKDYRVLKNQGVNVRWFQNEGMIPLDEYLIPLVSRFKRVVVFFDNDEAGIRASQKVCDAINNILANRATPLNLPISLLEENITDPSDLIKKKDREHLLSFLKDNNLI